MKKSDHLRPHKTEPDTMRPVYDFSGGVRGTTALRHAAGSNVVLIDPELMDVFPDADAVNAALRALAPLLRPHLPRPAAKTVSATKKTPVSSGKVPRRRSVASRGK